MEPGSIEHRALTAACAIANRNGVSSEQAVVIHSGSNVLVHLRPAPVVARVMTGTVVLHDDPERWLTREVSVLSFLARSGLAIRPSPLIDPGPYRHHGLWMTFCEWVDHTERTTLGDGPERFGHALRDLHRELSGFAGELGDLLDVQRDIERLHRQLRPRNDLSRGKIGSLRERLLALTTPVFGTSLPAQALHGDVSLTNLLEVNGRLVWNDFEDAFRGPLQWDVASYVMSLRDGGGADSTFITQMLKAYGEVAEAELAPFVEAQDLYGEIWQLYCAQRGR
jgi:Phosphotransferase enzyme family